MGVRRGLDADTRTVQVVMPSIYLCGVIEHEAQVIEALVQWWIKRSGVVMQSQTVVARGKIEVAGIRAPVHLHAYQANIKLLAGGEVVHLEGKMAQASEAGWAYSAQRRSARLNDFIIVSKGSALVQHHGYRAVFFR